MKPLLIVCGLVFAVSLLSGCSTNRTRSPWVNANVPDLGEIATGGDAATPANVATSKGSTAFQIPVGTMVEILPSGSFAFKTAAPVDVVTNHATATLTGPAAFTPPAQPSPADLARGFGVRAFYLAGLVCALAAALCLWRGYPLAAICAGGAAVALPVIANVVSSPAAIMVGSVLLALGVGLVVAYNLTRAKTRAQMLASLDPNAA